MIRIRKSPCVFAGNVGHRYLEDGPLTTLRLPAVALLSCVGLRGINFMRMLITIAMVGALTTGCATTPPATPMEAHLNSYAGAEAVTMNCPAYGGYGSVAQMRSDAMKKSHAREVARRDRGGCPEST